MVGRWQGNGSEPLPSTVPELPSPSSPEEPPGLSLGSQCQHRAQHKGGSDKWVTECAAHFPIPYSTNDGSSGGCQVLRRWVWRALPIPLQLPQLQVVIWRNITPTPSSPFQGTSNKQLKILVALPTKPSLLPVSKNLPRIGIWRASPAALTSPVPSLPTARGSGSGSC